MWAHTTLPCKVKLRIHILVTHKSHLKIKNHIQVVDNKCEAGGLLLGYRFLNFFFVTAITATNDAESSSVSFVLNSKEHIEQAKKIVRKYLFKPLLLGVWHSHVCNITKFSTQDQKSNLSLASQIGSIISTIVTLNDITKNYNYTSYYIKPNGKEYYCLTKIIKGKF